MEQCILMQNYLHFKKTRYSIHDVYVSMAISHSVCHVMTRPSSHPQSRAASKSIECFYALWLHPIFIEVAMSSKKLAKNSSLFFYEKVK